jgi:hypothetical protein
MPKMESELERRWFFTVGAEWILWEDPRTGKLVAFLVVLSEGGVFLEWRRGKGLVTGHHDDGEPSGRYKMTPVLVERNVDPARVARSVLRMIDHVRVLLAEPKPVPTIPLADLDAIADVVTDCLTSDPHLA